MERDLKKTQNKGLISIDKQYSNSNSYIDGEVVTCYTNVAWRVRHSLFMSFPYVTKDG